MARLLVLVVSLVMFSHNTLEAMAQTTTIAPELIEAIEGDNATFNCLEIISLADFTVEIQRPGDTDFSTLPISDPRLSVEEVNVTAVYTYGPVERAEDGSLFRCNLGGVPSTNSATLRVFSLSLDCNSYVNITEGGGLERLESGTNVCFVCFFDGPGVIDTGTEWSIGNPAEAIPSEDGSVIDGVLVIFDLATVFDQNLMLLVCEAGDGTSVYETAVSRAAFVPPTINGLTVVNETDTLMLLCDTSQSAPVPSPLWLDPSGTEVSTVASLVIENMDRSQAGLYTCVIMQGGNELSANVTVTVQYAPDVNTTVSSPHPSPRDQPLSLSCDYDSVPPPDITWLFEGTPFSESDPRVTIVSTETHSDFTLSGLMESEAGLYTCTASNLLGMDSVEITVTVQGEALTVGFSEVDYQALEGLGGRLITVVKREVNVGNVMVTVVPLTFGQLNAIGIMLTPDTTVDPAEFDQFRQDFSNATIDLVFPPSTGDEAMDLMIEYIDDDIDEPDEGFIVLAQVTTTDSQDESNLQLIGNGVALMIITDDDMISVGFEMNSYDVQENAGTVDNLVFVVKLNDMLSERILNVLLDVSVASSDTAERDVDFSIVAPINITFQPSEQQMAVAFNIIDDNILDDTESFSLILSNTGSSADFTIGGSVAQINIEDNEFLTIGFQQSMYTVSEGDGVVEVCVVLIDPADIPSGLFACGVLGTAPGSAESDVDFTSIPSDSVFPELEQGTLEMCFDIAITDDNETESTESFTVQLLRDLFFTEDYVILSPNETTVVIQDNDQNGQPFTVGFSEVDYQALEGLGGRLITVVKREVNVGNVMVTVVPLTFGQLNAIGIMLPPDTTVDPAEFDQFRQDFSNATIDLVFPPSTGDEAMDLMIEYIDDDINEPEEGFVVLAQVTTTNSQDESNLQLIGNGVALMIIADDDMISVGFEMTSYDVQETAGTVDNLVFVVKLNDMLSERILNVLLDVSVVGTAERDVDFSIVAPINITFQPSEQQMAVAFNIIDDNALENVESFSLGLSNTGSSPDFTIGVPVAQINIEDNEFLTIGFQQSVYTVSEGDGVVEVCVVLIDPADIPSGFFACGVLGTASGSAESDVDFTSIPSDSVFAELVQGTLEMCFDIAITDDNETESTESFTVQLLRDPFFTEDYVILSPNETTVVIQDNDQNEPPSPGPGSGSGIGTVRVGFDQDRYSVGEGDEYLEACIVIFSGELLGDLCLTFSTDYGTATSRADFIPVSQNITFPAGSGAGSRQCIRVYIVEDRILEETEQFYISVYFDYYYYYYYYDNDPPQEITLVNSFVNVLIVDNDFVLVGFELPSYSVMEGDSRMEVCVEILEGLNLYELARPISVRVSSGDESAIAFYDYKSVLEIVSLHIGDRVGSRGCITVYIINDNITEVTEYFSLNVFASDLAIVVAPQRDTTRVIITDDDVAMCPPLESPDNGNVSLTGMNVGSVATYTCDSGYTLVGSSERICLQNGEWSEEEPSCSRSFEIEFVNDTPAVNGDTVTIVFSSTVPLQSATCSVTKQDDQDCTGGTAVFSNLPPNRRRFDIRVEAATVSQTRTLMREFRSETTDRCSVHLINRGYTVTADAVIFEWQGTGPSADNRITSFTCTIDGRPLGDCSSPFTLLLLNLAPGAHELRIVPVDNGGCDRRIGRTVEFSV